MNLQSLKGTVDSLKKKCFKGSERKQSLGAPDNRASELRGCVLPQRLSFASIEETKRLIRGVFEEKLNLCFKFLHFSVECEVRYFENTLLVKVKSAKCQVVVNRLCLWRMIYSQRDKMTKINFVCSSPAGDVSSLHSCKGSPSRLLVFDLEL